MLASLKRRPRAGLALLACVAACTFAVEVPGQGRSTREQVMFVTVTDSDGAPVKGLRTDDFIVREDGLRREVLTAAPAETPATVALMVDNSTFTDPFIADMRRALSGFVERLGGRYPMALTTLGARPTIVVDYTLDKKALASGVGGIFPVPDSASYFLEGLVELTRGLAARDFERAVIVAVTSEGPEYSELHYGQVLARLRESGATLEALVLTKQGGPDMTEEGSKSRGVVLDEGTRGTGGSRVELLTSMALGEALDKLATALENQYRVTYARPESLIPPQKVEVSAARAGLQARGIPAKAPRG